LVRLLASLLVVVAPVACAVPPAPEHGVSRAEAITGGKLAGAGDIHATVALYGDYEGALAVFCSGVLVAPTVVLTAAHCVTHTDRKSGAFTTAYLPAEVSVIAGVVHAGAAAEMRAVAAVVTHQGFDGDDNLDPGDNPEGLGHADDLALLLLAAPAADRPWAAIPPLAALDAAMPAGTSLRITGYGYDGPSEQTAGYGSLYVAETPFVRRNAFELAAGGAGEPDACPGDSGGPAYLARDGALEVVGITSRGWQSGQALCGEGSVWTLAPAYADWIAAHARGDWPPTEPPPPPPPPPSPPSGEDDDGCVLGATPPRGGAGGWLLSVVALWAAARRRAPRRAQAGR
jgi:hypothetical protein